MGSPPPTCPSVPLPPTASPASLFEQQPRRPNRSDPLSLATGLGATLYCPGTRRDLCGDVVRQRAAGLRSMVLCLEDAVADADVAAGERNVVRALASLAGEAGLPQLFVRVRSGDQLSRLLRSAAVLGVVTGVVLPKFDGTGAALLREVQRAGERAGRRIYVMPVLESRRVLYRETRLAALLAVRRLLDQHRDDVLAVRLGATDMCGVFGLRRGPDLTVWDVAVVRDALADVVNIFGREADYVVTGPVREHFGVGDDAWMLREVELDRANGLLGKTVIHPSHVPVVHAALAVTHEEHGDALAVLGADGGGALPSAYGNKMNEARPHRVWAQAVVRRAEAFGVLLAGVRPQDLLACR